MVNISLTISPWKLNLPLGKLLLNLPRDMMDVVLSVLVETLQVCAHFFDEETKRFFGLDFWFRVGTNIAESE